MPQAKLGTTFGVNTRGDRRGEQSCTSHLRFFAVEYSSLIAELVSNTFSRKPCADGCGRFLSHVLRHMVLIGSLFALPGTKEQQTEHKQSASQKDANNTQRQTEMGSLSSHALADAADKITGIFMSTSPFLPENGFDKTMCVRMRCSLFLFRF